MIIAAILASMVGFDPIVPFNPLELDAETNARELRQIRNETGLRRFFITGPNFNGVMYRPFADGLYAQIGSRIVQLREQLKDTDIELNWWCSPSIRYVSNFPSIMDSDGHTSHDNKKCPLDDAFAADWCAKIKSVALARPKMICIEDDYTLGWGRGLGKSGACFCPRHLAAFAKRYGKPLSAKEIEQAFERRSAANLPIRRAFADTIRDSLVSLALKVRSTIDEVDPSIRVCVCDTGGNADRDGNCLEPVIRAFAGKTRPAVRPQGSIYGAETTPAIIPKALSHTQFVLERLPKDIETFYEADPYPHNRFYTSSAQMASLMAGAVAMGADDFLFYCLQYLDDPFEDRGYAKAYLAQRARWQYARNFIRDRQARLQGVRVYWRAEDTTLTRGHGGGHGTQLDTASYLLSKLSLPYTTRDDSDVPVLLTDRVAETMSDGEIRSLLSGGVLVDAPAASLLAERGFADELGTDVELFKSRPPIIGETILPAADYARAGRMVNAFYIFFAGTEGTVRTFARLTPRKGTEVWSQFTGTQKELITPSLTVATNRLGGTVAVLATSLAGNRSSGLFNLRKQELLRNLFRRLKPDSIPVAALNCPGIWLLPNVTRDERCMLVMVNNLSGEVREDVVLAFSKKWQDAVATRVLESGELRLIGRVKEKWTIPFALGQMQPEFLLLVAAPR